MKTTEIIELLRSKTRPDALIGMARFGINTSTAFGVSIPDLRKIAKKIGTDHQLAISLWNTGIHDARILSSMIDDPGQVTKSQMNNWAKDFNSWDVCDQCCNNLFKRTTYAWEKAFEWCGRNEEFVKRAGFALMAVLAVHEKTTPDEDFLKFFPYIEKESIDNRNFVKKAVNWALRQIGKRSLYLHHHSVKLAIKLTEAESKSARWIGSDALRELTNEKIISRIKK
ncbi:MAG: DNA alkylation repair protein [Melioribacteraceae bacterium]|nr:DNA alkylation repair protein [Melioribacteraceae bacterium]MCF8354434.1 DNA alkylation repair protein [Melioribacteraceae bacterium]MCF8394044.1 DNA alkylation repair protein [Melioribacteraceae bacterium]MCF8419810.1 DNA alkylation repair protein [Melioribacteraceae bacterium]